MKKIFLVLAALSVVFGVFVASPSRPAFASGPPCSPDSTTCSPGGGWTKVEIKHVSSDMCMGSGEDNLDPIWVGLCTDAFKSQTWWTRLINSGLDTQYTQVGNDGYFHDIGFSGGQWKLETPSDSQYFVNWDESGGAWSYANQADTYFAGDPNQEQTFLLEDLNPLTHWVQDTPYCC